MPNKQSIFIIFIVVIVILALGGWFIFMRDRGEILEPIEEITEGVTLNVSSAKATYKAGEEIQLLLQLSNSGNAETCASDMVEGNIRFVSFTRDGEEVMTRVAPISFIEALSLILEKSLAALRPGESVDISMASFVDPGLAKQALRTVALTSVGSEATFYEAETPGEYELTLGYEYVGPPSSECPNVFRGATNSATISFTITP